MSLLLSSRTAHDRAERNPVIQHNTRDNCRKRVQYTTKTGEHELRSPVSNA